MSSAAIWQRTKKTIKRAIIAKLTNNRIFRVRNARELLIAKDWCYKNQKKLKVLPGGIVTRISLADITKFTSYYLSLVGFDVHLPHW